MKPLTEGRAERVVWLPEVHARVGHVVKVRAEDGTWDDGWRVVEVYTRATAEDMRHRGRDHLTQRAASDI